MRKQIGVTLLELMIVVAIVGILAAVAYPSYRTNVERANRIDAHDMLSNISLRLERVYLQQNRYPLVLSAIGLEADTVVSANGHYDVTMIGDDPDGQRYVLIAVPRGGQVSDTNCSAIGLTESGARIASDDQSGLNGVLDDSATLVDAQDYGNLCW